MKPTIIILAAGENSRFFPLNTTTHKGALTLCGKPLISRTLSNLAQCGFRDIVIVVSSKDYGGNGLSGLISDNDYGLKIKYVLQPEAKGMGDALLRARQYLSNSFAVVFPTSLSAGDMLLEMIKKAGQGGTLAVNYTKEPWLYGVVTIEGDRVTSIVEKPEAGSEPSNLRVLGVYFLNSKYVSYLEKTTLDEYGFEAALNTYLRDNRVNFVELSGTMHSLKYPWHLFLFQSGIFAQMKTHISPHARLAGDVILDESDGAIVVESGASLGHATHIVGPCFIGKDVTIGDFSLIRHSSLEQGVTVGAHSDVARTIVMEESSMHNGYLGDSIVGRLVKIGAGFITSNKRIDRKTITIDTRGKKIDLGNQAFGTVIGDGARIGIRVSVMPGKLIGADTFIYPSSTVYENIPHSATLKIKQAQEII